MTNAIHHVTAIAGNARRNLDFHTRVLGLRLVKKTVNFDDPGTYHFYYGDERGRPGTILTFFPWEHAAPGRNGIGLTMETAFRIPEGAIGYWLHRFLEKGVAHSALEKRFGETILRFQDPDGMSLALVAVPGAEGEPAWTASGVPAEHALRGFHGVTLMVGDDRPTGAVLTDVFGYSEAGREDGLVRFKADSPGPGGVVDLRAAFGFLPGRMGRGSVHHVAFRASSDGEQAAMARRLAENHRIGVTPQKDRNYFRSVYFREPGGILFEIATDDPGFAVDEPADALGRALKLPPFLESRRPSIEAALPDIS